MMRFGSLFAGIGGIDLGLERAGMECAWQVEIDPFCRKVLTKHWPDVPKFEDVREVGAHNLPPVDVIAGGFPCQDISLAGKGAGLEGERSGLWWEYHRIIRELRPRYVIVENVRALTVRGLDAVLGSLADIGFDAEWQMLSAESVGAPHRRDRIFIVAYRNGIAGEIGGVDQADAGEGGKREGFSSRGGVHDWGQPGAGEDAAHGYSSSDSESTMPINAEASRMPGDVADAKSVDGKRTVTCRNRGRRPEAKARGCCDGPDTNCKRLEIRKGKERLQKFTSVVGVRWWATEPAVCRVVDGVSHGLDGYRGRVATGVANRVGRLRGLGNAVVPQVAEFVGRLVMEHHAQEAQ